MGWKVEGYKDAGRGPFLTSSFTTKGGFSFSIIPNVSTDSYISESRGIQGVIILGHWVDRKLEKMKL